MRREKRKKQEQQKRRFEAIKDLMSTFAMSTVAVVAVVTLVPASPKAEIVKAVALTEEVSYQVQVTDEDNALDLDTLVVVLENQLEYYEEPITLGENSGFFESLKTNTQYRLSVYGNKGFGLERLDTTTVTTRDVVGGTILNIDIVSDVHSAYYADISINDPESKYISISLFYGYAMHPGEEIIYTEVLITQDRMMIEIFDIFTENEVHFYLEGTTVEGTEILDEMTVIPPYNFYASVYRDYTSNDEIGFYLYGDTNVEVLQYEMKVYIGELLVKTQVVKPSEGVHGDTRFRVTGLTEDTTYRFECTASYVDPHTLRTVNKVIYEEELTTLGEYSYTYDIETVGNEYIVTITVTDPNHHFQEAYYSTYDTSGEFDSWLMDGVSGFTPDGDSKTCELIIVIPDTESYKIIIGLRNETDSTIREIIEVIINE